MYRISVDTGGTFTDVVVADEHGRLHVSKALTTYERGFAAVAEALGLLVPELGSSVEDILARSSQFTYGTTRSTNAIVERKTARTALLTTAGFPDVLLLREGGKLGPFTQQEYEPAYIPRYLTFEIAERVDAEGGVLVPLDEESVVAAARACAEHGVEAVAVCLLWSTVNGTHEARVGELLAEHLPGVPVTLSHRLNPVIREYRRASSAAIDASLKPLMQAFLQALDDDLRNAGFTGNVLVSTSFGGSWPTAEVVARPIYSVGSGPAMAPVAAVAYGSLEPGAGSGLLVCDTGGTTFDVSLVSDGRIHYTDETWLGGKWTGHITGTRAVDVSSIGAGGGSIVWVDEAGLLHVGPRSAGADPGPACYGRGGTLPTITDAALVLGFLDPDAFLGGRLHLDRAAAEAALRPVAERIGLGTRDLARGAFRVMTQNLVTAIRAITVAQGIDPRELTIVAGGGASGLDCVQFGRELGCRTALMPRTAGALSACGGLFSDVISSFSVSRYVETRSAAGLAAANEALAAATGQAEAFLAGLTGLSPVSTALDAFVDARYPKQVWELETPLSGTVLDEDDLRTLEATFDALHERVFAVSEPGQHLECLTWKVRATAVLPKPSLAGQPAADGSPEPLRRQPVTFAEAPEEIDTPVYAGDALAPGMVIPGPAIVVEPTSTLVVDPGATARVTGLGSYLIDLGEGEAR